VFAGIGLSPLPRRRHGHSFHVTGALSMNPGRLSCKASPMHFSPSAMAPDLPLSRVGASI
jgi:hypothetical protein